MEDPGAQAYLASFQVAFFVYGALRHLLHRIKIIDTVCGKFFCVCCTQLNLVLPRTLYFKFFLSISLPEFGPWRPMDDGSLVRNPYAWTQAASLVFLEQPVGVGFSHSTEPVTLNTYNDFMASKDNLQVIQSFQT